MEMQKFERGFIRIKGMAWLIYRPFGISPISILQDLDDTVADIINTVRIRAYHIRFTSNLGENWRLKYYS